MNMKQIKQALAYECWKVSVDWLNSTAGAAALGAGAIAHLNDTQTKVIVRGKLPGTSGPTYLEISVKETF